jgi:hypothetical protein
MKLDTPIEIMNGGGAHGKESVDRYVLKMEKGNP